MSSEPKSPVYFVQYFKRSSPELKKPSIRLTVLPPDMEITVVDDVYLLHSTTLRECSRFFETSLSVTWWKPENTHSGPDGIKYRYNLDSKDIGANLLSAVLRPVPATATSSTIGPEAAMRSEDHSEPETEPELEDSNKMLSAVTQAYQRFLRLLCRKRCDFRQFHEFRELEDLVQLADLYCALPAVSVAIEQLTILVSLNVEAFQIDAPSLMCVALKIRSKLLISAPFVRLVNDIIYTYDEQFDEKLQRMGWPWLEGPVKLRDYAMREAFRIMQLRARIDRAVTKFAARSSISNGFGTSAGYVMSNSVVNIWESSTPRNEGTAYRAIYDLINPHLTTGHELEKDLISIMENNIGVMVSSYSSKEELSCAKFRHDIDYPWDDSEDW